MYTPPELPAASHPPWEAWIRAQTHYQESHPKKPTPVQRPVRAGERH